MRIIKAILVFKGRNLECTIESVEGIHELEIYDTLKAMFPAYISINYDDESTPEGYSYKYQNGLKSIAICRF